APPRGRPESAAMLEQVTELRLARQALQSRLTDEPPEIDRGALREYARFIGNAYQTQAANFFRTAIETDTPFHERLVEFWSNHFAVSADKQPVNAIAGLYRDEAIRPHVSGNFSTMLTAVAKHPAMLLYLDNQTSIGPNSLLGSRANRNRDRRTGLNENLAREILELHTLGVDGGYTQDDVIEFSKSLTGWSIGGAGQGGRAARFMDSGRPGEFTFRQAVHEPGSKTILGQRFREGGVDEAEAVLAYLAEQPATAKFLATKLARHFVADEPPAALVDELAQTYLDNDGELAPVNRVLIHADDPWREALTKYKTPQEYLISTFRALGQVPADLNLPALAQQLGQRPMTPGSPAGWPDIADHWNGGDALLKRIEWTTALGAQIGDRVDALALVDEILGDVAGDSTRTGISRAESGAQAIALAFSAPEFQRR
ncbi:MAG: DUF1800 domain-containing protein, partial [Gammaproteobacteria bacterium]|nr:DUF1800 domain-containing protein [Gammaproteobacteria bacterium]